jgi:hypothetical protein
MTNLASRQKRELLQIVEAAERELTNTEDTPFTENAFSSLKEKIAEYSVQLISESVKNSRRRQSEVVSTQNVELASQYLIPSTAYKIYGHLSTIGGIFLGVSVSTVAAMIDANATTVRSAVLTVVFTLIGGALVAAHIVRDLRN